MENPINQTQEGLKEIIPRLASPDPVDEDEIEALWRMCGLVLGYTFSLSESGEFDFDRFPESSNSFKDFLRLYSEFCYHVIKRQLDDMEVQTILEDAGLNNLEPREED